MKKIQSCRRISFQELAEKVCISPQVLFEEFSWIFSSKIFPLNQFSRRFEDRVNLLCGKGWDGVGGNGIKEGKGEKLNGDSMQNAVLLGFFLANLQNAMLWITSSFIHHSQFHFFASPFTRKHPEWRRLRNCVKRGVTVFRESQTIIARKWESPWKCLLIFDTIDASAKFTAGRRQPHQEDTGKG